MSRKADIVSVKKNMCAPLMRKKPFYGGTDAGKGSCPTKCGGTAAGTSPGCRRFSHIPPNRIPALPPSAFPP